MKETLNSEYNFVSKALDLADPTDSVNFDEIVAVSPPPNDVLGLLCSQVAGRHKTGLGRFMTTSLLQVSRVSSVILYLTDTEKYGRSTAASQYFLQLAGYLGIPVIAWNADNSGLQPVTVTQHHCSS